MSEIGLRLLHGLAGDRPDGLLLVGDATQQIFTRGYSLKGLGIDIGGRGLVLRKNYRNTREILVAAFRWSRQSGRRMLRRLVFRLRRCDRNIVFVRA